MIDRIIPEPLGGAHRDPKVAIRAVGGAMREALGELAGAKPKSLVANRRRKYLDMGTKGLAA